MARVSTLYDWATLLLLCYSILTLCHGDAVLAHWTSLCNGVWIAQPLCKTGSFFTLLLTLLSNLLAFSCYTYRGILLLQNAGVGRGSLTKVFLLRWNKGRVVRRKFSYVKRTKSKWKIRYSTISLKNTPFETFLSLKSLLLEVLGDFPPDLRVCIYTTPWSFEDRWHLTI